MWASMGLGLAHNLLNGHGLGILIYQLILTMENSEESSNQSHDVQINPPNWAPLQYSHSTRFAPFTRSWWPTSGPHFELGLRTVIFLESFLVECQQLNFIDK